MPSKGQDSSGRSTIADDQHREEVQGPSATLHSPQDLMVVGPANQPGRIALRFRELLAEEGCDLQKNSSSRPGWNRGLQKVPLNPSKALGMT